VEYNRPSGPKMKTTRFQSIKYRNAIENEAKYVREILETENYSEEYYTRLWYEQALVLYSMPSSLGS
jgi:hypothetical protein